MRDEIFLSNLEKKRNEQEEITKKKKSKRDK